MSIETAVETITPQEREWEELITFKDFPPDFRQRLIGHFEYWEGQAMITREMVPFLVRNITYRETPTQEEIEAYGVDGAQIARNFETGEWIVYRDFFEHEGKARSPESQSHIGLHELMGHALLDSGVLPNDASQKLRGAAIDTKPKDETRYVHHLLSIYNNEPDEDGIGKLEKAAGRAKKTIEVFREELGALINIEKIAERFTLWIEQGRAPLAGEGNQVFNEVFAEHFSSNGIVLARLREIWREREEDEEDAEYEEYMQTVQESLLEQNDMAQMSEMASRVYGGKTMEPRVEPPTAAQQIQGGERFSVVRWLLGPLLSGQNRH